MMCLLVILGVLYFIVNCALFVVGLISGFENEELDPTPRRIEGLFPGYRFGYWAAQR